MTLGVWRLGLDRDVITELGSSYHRVWGRGLIRPVGQGLSARVSDDTWICCTLLVYTVVHMHTKEQFA